MRIKTAWRAKAWMEDNIKVGVQEIGRAGTGLIRRRTGTSERHNETAGSIKCGEFDRRRH